MGRRSIGVLTLWLFGHFAVASPDIMSDVVYGHKDGMALTYDVFTPDNANGAGILHMVSGGWFSVWQPPENRVDYYRQLLDAGFTVFAVHHGSAPRYKVPEAVSDVRGAVRHIRDHASTFGVDPERLGVWGGSAGGHLALMLGLNGEGKPEVSGEGRRRLGPTYVVSDGDADVAAVVAYYPPVDLRGMTGPSERFPALDFPAEQAMSISPVLFVTADDPPIKLIHGDKDDLVDVDHSERLKAEMEQVGVNHDLLVIKGGDHGFRNPEHRQQAMEATVDWFNRHLATD